MKMKNQLSKLALVAALLATPLVQAATYVIDTKGAHAAVAFKFKHLNISWLTGEFEDFDGQFTYDEANPKASTIEVNVRTASIDSNHAERDKHMRSAKFLDTDQFPSAEFASKRVEVGADGALTVVGDLTLHGVTKEVAIDAEMTGAGDDPWGGYRAGFEGSVTIDTTEFGMKFPPSNEVELLFFLEGIRQ